MQNKILEYIKEAVRLSRENMNSGDGGPFGAVIVKDGEIISSGSNKVTSKNDPTAHAEIEAIREACRILGTFNLSGCEIYSSCEPCPMCLSAIYWARLDKIYFANTKKDAAEINFDDNFIYEEISKPHDKRKIPVMQIDHDDAKKVFDEWVKKEEKIQY
ncbi:MAG: nucleoside deaminase [Bacteroidetes bacterium]|nr:nucleoside deaminase [Bacteroidota bacterium]